MIRLTRQYDQKNLTTISLETTLASIQIEMSWKHFHGLESKKRVSSVWLRTWQVFPGSLPGLLLLLYVAYNALVTTSESPITCGCHINERNKNISTWSHISKNKFRFGFSTQCFLCLLSSVSCMSLNLRWLFRLPCESLCSYVCVSVPNKGFSSVFIKELIKHHIMNKWGNLNTSWHRINSPTDP